MRKNSNIIGPKRTISVTDAPGVHSLEDVAGARRNGSWPVQVVLAWTTTSGSLGTVGDPARDVTSLTVVASASQGTVSYSIQSGSLPSGATLNSSTGVITGFSAVGSSTTSNFTIRATSSVSAEIFEDRSFSITVTPPIVSIYDYTGSDVTFTVPSGVTLMKVIMWGAGGGANSSLQGGGGGYTDGTFNVTSGDVLRIRVGQSGGGSCSGNCSGTSSRSAFGGGGSAYEAQGGGGGTFLFKNGSAHANLIAVAGGGGGGGGGSGGYYGGGGGGTTGGNANSGSGSGGTQSSGNATFTGANGNLGGGGGGGYYGGRAGNRVGSWHHSGGGGGSGYIGGLNGDATTSTGATGGDPPNFTDTYNGSSYGRRNQNGRLVLLR